MQTQIFKEKIAKLEGELAEKAFGTSIAEPNLVSSVESGKYCRIK